MPMVNQFATVPTVQLNRNAFERNHTWKGTINAGYLYPVFFDEVLPGDTKRLNSTFFGRLATPFVPVLDNIYLDYHLFFVANRLVWNNWKKFMGERINPTDSIDYLVPSITSDSTNGFTPGGFFDCLSIPPSIANLSVTSATFYARAYNLIWNEWYRDENLQNSVTVPTGDGPDSESDYPLLKRGKRQDYFTSALPAPQKGPGASLPLSNNVPVYGDGYPLTLVTRKQNPSGQLNVVNNTCDLHALNYTQGTNSSNQNVTTLGGLTNINKLLTDNDAWSGAGNFGGSAFPTSCAVGVPTKDFLENNYINNGIKQTGLVADLSSATAVTINSLRQAIALQQFLEQDMRGGTRYIELILSHFGVQCPDYRLQRPEFLGGTTTRVSVSPIAQTSSTDSTSPQGNLAAIGTVGSTGSGFTHSFTEHGVILGLVSIRADLSYQQGVDRHFLRKTRYDYFFPTLAHLGEQTIYNKEIYAQGDSVTDSTTGDIVDDMAFGYQERFGEYRYKNSYITGQFRSSYAQSLDVWHLAQKFNSLPTLSSQFIEENPPIDRIIAVQNEPQFLLDVYHELTDIRELPLYGTPGLRRV